MKKTYIVLNDGQVLRPETADALDRALRAAAQLKEPRVGQAVPVNGWLRTVSAHRQDPDWIEPETDK